MLETLFKIFIGFSYIIENNVNSFFKKNAKNHLEVILKYRVFILKVISNSPSNIKIISSFFCQEKPNSSNRCNFAKEILGIEFEHEFFTFNSPSLIIYIHLCRFINDKKGFVLGNDGVLLQYLG